MKSIQELMTLEGRACLVTGGGGHIGSAACDALAELGADVVVLDASADRCNQVAERIRAEHGVQALPLVTDLADEAAVRAVPGAVVARFKRLDVIVNSAAFVGTSTLEGWVTPFDRQSAGAWRDALEVNLTAVFVLAQASARALTDSGHGSIINLSSIYGLLGPDMRLYEGTDMGNPVAYAASKGGLLQLTRWLATVLAPAVRVNAITPGGVWRDQPETFVQRYAARTPLARMATEEDLKGAVAYLASDLSAYVTGHNLVVDGGWTVW